MKRNKAPDIDGLTAEHLLFSHSCLPDMLGYPRFSIEFCLVGMFLVVFVIAT